jgi:hypothetical protein
VEEEKEIVTAGTADGAPAADDAAPQMATMPGPGSYDLVASAGEAALAVLNAPTALSPRERVRLAIERAMGRRYHESHAAAVAGLIAEFSRRSAKLLTQCRYEQLPALINGLYRDTHGLESQPPPPIVPQVDKHAPGLLNAGWSGGELDLLRGALKPAERIVSYDENSTQVECEGQSRVITRRALRDRARPRTWSNVATWERQFPPIPNELRPGERI